MTQSLSDRYIRQQDIVPLERIQSTSVLIIGCGAIGSVVAQQLARMGVAQMGLCDPDTVGPENLSCQGFREKDLEFYKTEALADQIHDINSDTNVNVYNNKFKKSEVPQHDATFCLVDSITTRKFIWENTDSHFFGDARMKGGDSLRVLVAADDKSRRHYPTTLFAAEEAQQGACTAKTTVFAANVAAGLLVSKYAFWLRRFPIIDSDLVINLVTCEVTPMNK